MTYVKVPLDKLEEVEKARVALYKLLQDEGFLGENKLGNLACITQITQPIWYVANRKWEKV